MGNAVELIANGGVNSWVAMTVDVAPHATGTIQEFAAVNIDQVAALSAGDDERLVIGHLGEGVPVVAVIPVGEESRAEG